MSRLTQAALKGIVFFLVAYAASGIARAQTIPNTVNCTTAVAANGMPAMIVRIKGPVPAWAMTDWMPNGLPRITYGSMYFDLPPLIQRFTSWHECGHASTRDPNEFAANCFALEHGGFSRAEVEQIGDFYTNLLGVFPPQYGGSGPAFWQGTVEKCPQVIPNRNHPPTPVPPPTPPSAAKQQCQNDNDGCVGKIVSEDTCVANNVNSCTAACERAGYCPQGCAESRFRGMCRKIEKDSRDKCQEKLHDCLADSDQ
jgi:hypothetical protein